MDLSDISTLRLHHQQIEGSAFHTAKDLVSWMGAMQAQDFAMSRWAIGKRVPDSTEKSIVEAYNQGEIIRTHLMRPTWHFAAAVDIHWMLDLTAPQIRKVMKTNDKRLELNDTVYSTTNAMLEKVLSNELNMTREELVVEFDNIHIRTDENRLSHIMMRAELDGVVCSGPLKGNKLTYSLLTDRVPEKNVFTREEALAELAMRYFKSHCPATLRDFIWWSGLSITEARRALESVKMAFISETIENETYWITNSFKGTPTTTPSVHLLPAYDEYLISYANRSASLEGIDNKKTISDNGIFRPIIVAGGQVKGLWKRTAKKDTVLVETDFFQQPGPGLIEGVANEVRRYGVFLDKKTELLPSF